MPFIAEKGKFILFLIQIYFLNNYINKVSEILMEIIRPWDENAQLTE